MCREKKQNKHLCTETFDAVHNVLTKWIVLILCMAIVLVWHQEALCDIQVPKTQPGSLVLRCGDEVRVVTGNGEIIEGKVTYAEADSLTISRSINLKKTLNLYELVSAHRINRHTGMGVVLGSVIGAGVTVVVIRGLNSSNNNTSKGFDGLSGIGAEVTAGIIATVGGAMLGAIIGGTIGHKSKSFRKVNLDVSPVCVFPSGKIAPVGLTLAINF